MLGQKLRVSFDQYGLMQGWVFLLFEKCVKNARTV